MEVLLFIILLPLPFAGHPLDPAGVMWSSKAEARSMACVRMSQAEAHERHPTVVAEPRARATSEKTDALICSRTIMREGERPARDEAVLQNLRESVAELTEVASAQVPDDHLLHLDAFYPQPTVAAKIAVAARTHLAERGRKVSDRVPLLAAGDIAVLGRMPPEKAYPLACARYFAEGSLQQKQAFIGLILLDARETQLHAGLCLDGAWKWLR